MNRKALAARTAINWWRVTGWSIAGLLVLLPLAAMQVTREVAWTPADFAFAAVLIGAVGLTIEFAFRPQVSRAQRQGAVILALTCFALIWINAAVGIIGAEDDPANIAYYAIVMVALLIAAIGRFRAVALERGAGVAAVAMLVAAVFATAAAAPGYAPGTIAFHIVPAAAFAFAAILFRRAAPLAQPSGEKRN
ncbi:hypothetical protein [Sphingomonas rubra]|uniref:Uncharacterized protein n=1 Tax=Sphingomonas rubra TaxID=634430 RepID=A0A1I5RB97_9SPHN|nr:hypothetical protein [Sphingomonas rubra]SFP55789.1 hypothetical protein SAMN04488241_103139 [Sphingomonas rubra]